MVHERTGSGALSDWFAKTAGIVDKMCYCSSLQCQIESEVKDDWDQVSVGCSDVALSHWVHPEPIQQDERIPSSATTPSSATPKAHNHGNKRSKSMTRSSSYDFSDGMNLEPPSQVFGSISSCCSSLPRVVTPPRPKKVARSSTSRRQHRDDDGSPSRQHNESYPLIYVVRRDDESLNSAMSSRSLMDQCDEKDYDDVIPYPTVSSFDSLFITRDGDGSHIRVHPFVQDDETEGRFEGGQPIILPNKRSLPGVPYLSITEGYSV
eukprot:scaffold11079_cov60-Attheya_sp.AAC.1